MRLPTKSIMMRNHPDYPTCRERRMKQMWIKLPPFSLSSAPVTIIMSISTTCHMLAQSAHLNNWNLLEYECYIRSVELSGISMSCPSVYVTAPPLVGRGSGRGATCTR